ncbi:HNH nuclease [Pantoea sp. VH_18]|nr:HNH nuclease [Pantoea sp. VH_24]KAA5954300.1 HNH nuclease [Pantoea sp. VH_16]KAA5960298.1 HNH nuclease [Pantoea sp. VH_18]KAA5992705.1 HNH nuclease [Pantoea sp. M_1]KAA5996966.1 HNH nuclease [Pantoea sp. F_7]KAA6005245.1 HNH nuclease [Pantoea sp. F_18]KAA6007139.1 HNH nuclease [Pantoea sp. F_5]KAA6009389.1 HNH nuclease [Pantoea sp. F_15]KAA6018739.1 HNH nuclease [Pantoea sp. F_17]KAA6020633.1 HNH nuclease [Pantoea sp. F_12]KAA6023846.1 HNH nuclease [Pantoea sp. F_16]KAA6030854.1 HNH n
MLLTGTSQRQKSWSCEHCDNFKNNKDISICKTCYWAYPEEYSHLAMTEARRIILEFKGITEIDIHNKIKKISQEEGLSIQDFIKVVLNTI